MVDASPCGKRDLQAFSVIPCLVFSPAQQGLPQNKTFGF